MDLMKKVKNNAQNNQSDNNQGQFASNSSEPFQPDNNVANFDIDDNDLNDAWGDNFSDSNDSNKGENTQKNDIQQSQKPQQQVDLTDIFGTNQNKQQQQHQQTQSQQQHSQKHSAESNQQYSNRRGYEKNNPLDIVEEESNCDRSMNSVLYNTNEYNTYENHTNKPTTQVKGNMDNSNSFKVLFGGQIPQIGGGNSQAELPKNPYQGISSQQVKEQSKKAMENNQRQQNQSLTPKQNQQQYSSQQNEFERFKENTPLNKEKQEQKNQQQHNNSVSSGTVISTPLAGFTSSVSTSNGGRKTKSKNVEYNSEYIRQISELQNIYNQERLEQQSSLQQRFNQIQMWEEDLRLRQDAINEQLEEKRVLDKKIQIKKSILQDENEILKFIEAQNQLSTLKQNFDNANFTHSEQISTLQYEKIELEQELKHQHERLRQFVAKSKKQKEAFMIAFQKINLKDQIEGMKEEIQQMVEQEKEGCMQSATALAQRLLKVSATNQAYQKEIKKLTSDKQEKELKIQSDAQHYQISEKALKDSHAKEIKTLSDKLNVSNQKLAEEQSKTKKELTQLNSKVNELQQVINQHVAEIELLKSEIEDKDLLMKTQEDTIEAKTKEFKLIEKKLKLKEKETSSSSSKTKELEEALNNQKEGYEVQIKSLKESNEQQQQQFQQEIFDLNSQLAAREQRLHKLDDSIAQLNEKLAQSQKDFKQQQQESNITHEKEKKQIKEEYERKISTEQQQYQQQMLTQLNLMKQEHLKNQNSIQTKDKEILTLNTQNSTYQKQIKTLQDSIKELQQQNKKLEINLKQQNERVVLLQHSAENNIPNRENLINEVELQSSLTHEEVHQEITEEEEQEVYHNNQFDHKSHHEEREKRSHNAHFDQYEENNHFGEEPTFEQNNNIDDKVEDKIDTNDQFSKQLEDAYDVLIQQQQKTISEQIKSVEQEEELNISGGWGESNQSPQKHEEPIDHFKKDNHIQQDHQTIDKKQTDKEEKHNPEQIVKQNEQNPFESKKENHNDTKHNNKQTTNEYNPFKTDQDNIFNNIFSTKSQYKNSQKPENTEQNNNSNSQAKSNKLEQQYKKTAELVVQNYLNDIDLDDAWGNNNPKVNEVIHEEVSIINNSIKMTETIEKSEIPFSITNTQNSENTENKEEKQINALDFLLNGDHDQGGAASQNKKKKKKKKGNKNNSNVPLDLFEQAAAPSSNTQHVEDQHHSLNESKQQDTSVQSIKSQNDSKKGDLQQQKVENDHQIENKNQNTQQLSAKKEEINQNAPAAPVVVEAEKPQQNDFFSSIQQNIGQQAFGFFKTFLDKPKEEEKNAPKQADQKQNSFLSILNPFGSTQNTKKQETEKVKQPEENQPKKEQPTQVMNEAKQNTPIKTNQQEDDFATESIDQTQKSKEVQQQPQQQQQPQKKKEDSTSSFFSILSNISQMTQFSGTKQSNTNVQDKQGDQGKSNDNQSIFLSLINPLYNNNNTNQQHQEHKVTTNIEQPLQQQQQQQLQTAIKDNEQVLDHAITPSQQKNPDVLSLFTAANQEKQTNKSVTEIQKQDQSVKKKKTVLAQDQFTELIGDQQNKESTPLQSEKVKNIDDLFSALDEKKPATKKKGKKAVLTSKEKKMEQDLQFDKLLNQAGGSISPTKDQEVMHQEPSIAKIILASDQKMNDIEEKQIHQKQDESEVVKVNEEQLPQSFEQGNAVKSNEEEEEEFMFARSRTKAFDKEQQNAQETPSSFNAFLEIKQEHQLPPAYSKQHTMEFDSMSQNLIQQPPPHQSSHKSSTQIKKDDNCSQIQTELTFPNTDSNSQDKPLSYYANNPNKEDQVIESKNRKNKSSSIANYYNNIHNLQNSNHYISSLNSIGASPQIKAVQNLSFADSEKELGQNFGLSQHSLGLVPCDKSGATPQQYKIINQLSSLSMSQEINYKGNNVQDLDNIDDEKSINTNYNANVQKLSDSMRSIGLSNFNSESVLHSSNMVDIFLQDIKKEKQQHKFKSNSKRKFSEGFQVSGPYEEIDSVIEKNQALEQDQDDSSNGHYQERQNLSDVLNYHSNNDIAESNSKNNQFIRDNAGVAEEEEEEGSDGNSSSKNMRFSPQNKLTNGSMDQKNLEMQSQHSEESEDKQLVDLLNNQRLDEFSPAFMSIKEDTNTFKGSKFTLQIESVDQTPAATGQLTNEGFSQPLISAGSSQISKSNSQIAPTAQQPSENIHQENEISGNNKSTEQDNKIENSNLEEKQNQDESDLDLNEGAWGATNLSPKLEEEPLNIQDQADSNIITPIKNNLEDQQHEMNKSDLDLNDGWNNQELPEEIQNNKEQDDNKIETVQETVAVQHEEIVDAREEKLENDELIDQQQETVDQSNENKEQLIEDTSAQVHQNQIQEQQEEIKQIADKVEEDLDVDSVDGKWGQIDDDIVDLQDQQQDIKETKQEDQQDQNQPEQLDEQIKEVKQEEVILEAEINQGWTTNEEVIEEVNIEQPQKEETHHQEQEKQQLPQEEKIEDLEIDNGWGGIEDNVEDQPQNENQTQEKNELQQPHQKKAFEDLYYNENWGDEEGEEPQVVAEQTSSHQIETKEDTNNKNEDIQNNEQVNQVKQQEEILDEDLEFNDGWGNNNDDNEVPHQEQQNIDQQVKLPQETKVVVEVNNQEETNKINNNNIADFDELEMEDDGWGKGANEEEEDQPAIETKKLQNQEQSEQNNLESKEQIQSGENKIENGIQEEDLEFNDDWGNNQVQEEEEQKDSHTFQNNLNADKVFENILQHSKTDSSSQLEQKSQDKQDQQDKNESGIWHVQKEPKRKSSEHKQKEQQDHHHNEKQGDDLDLDLDDAWGSNANQNDEVGEETNKNKDEQSLVEAFNPSTHFKKNVISTNIFDNLIDSSYKVDTSKMSQSQNTSQILDYSSSISNIDFAKVLEPTTNKAATPTSADPWALLGNEGAQTAKPKGKKKKTTAVDLNIKKVTQFYVKAEAKNPFLDKPKEQEEKQEDANFFANF